MSGQKTKMILVVCALAVAVMAIYRQGQHNECTGRKLSLISEARAETAQNTGTGLAKKDNEGPQHTLHEGKAPTFLFVLAAKKGTFKKGRLVLHDIASQVVYFSDRPNRIAGNMNIAEFIEMWDSGDDSFKKDPPNAALSIVERGGINTPVIEISDPKVEDGHSLSFKTKVLTGKVPRSMGPTSVFVDTVVVHHVGRRFRPVGHTTVVVHRR